MKIAIILGNRMNDDKSITARMQQRLNLTLDLDKQLDIDYIIVSGGIANEIAGIAEATVMKEYLIKNGIKKDKIIEENNSLTTVQNAKYSINIALKYHPDMIIVCSSIEHFTKQSYNVCDIFNQALNGYQTKLLFYTESE